MKVLIIITDGVGLKNFSYGKFSQLAKSMSIELIYWNKTKFNLSEIGLNEVKLSDRAPSPLTDIFKQSKIIVYLNYFKRKFKNRTFDNYKFPSNKKGWRNKFKFILVHILVIFFFKNRFLIQSFIHFLERRSKYYNDCISQLKKINPDFVFASNQRSILAIAPLLAAKDLNIPSGSFIFSWDNLPKATMILETDFYFVWSNYMKNEILTYYENISPKKIIVGGTPQFEPHFLSESIIPKNEFYYNYELNSKFKYILFSGDDLTTSPFDHLYLETIIQSVININKHSAEKYGILFRKCPTDITKRYDYLIKEYSELVFPIEPDWRPIGKSWDNVMPMEYDSKLLISTIFYSELVINLGSTMVFDAVCLNKPCCYLNFDVVSSSDWSTKKIYEFIHFKSMPSEKSVFWLNNYNTVEKDINNILSNLDNIELSNTRDWFDIIVSKPANDSSSRILQEIKNIILSL